MTKNSKKFVALDIETTDLDPAIGKVIEIGMAKYAKGEKTGEWKSFINPGEKIPPLIQSITGIKDKDVDSAPAFGEVKKEVKKFVGDYPIVGHNVQFDLNFLAAKGLTLDNAVFDTWKLATIILPGLPSHSLETLSSFLKLKHLESHRALDDADASAQLFLLLKSKIYDTKLNLLLDIDKLMRDRSWDLKPVFAEVLEDRLAKKKNDNLFSFSLAKKKQEPPAKKSKAKKSLFAATRPESYFSATGKLQKQINNFEYRPNQVALAKIVMNALSDGRRVAVETPPGVGKSLAYLLPAIYFSQSKKQQVFLLQGNDQEVADLEREKLPLLERLLPFGFNSQVLYQAEQYLCPARLQDYMKNTNLDESELTGLIKVLMWLPTTKEGNLKEISLVGDERKILANINAGFCTGEEGCGHSKKECFFQASRRRAQQADLLIGEHGLLAKDRVAEQLPDFKNVIIDDADLLEKNLTSGAGSELSAEILGSLLSLVFTEKKTSSILRLFSQQKIRSGVAQDLNEAIMLTEELQEKAYLFFGLFAIVLKKSSPEGGYQGKITVRLDKSFSNSPDYYKVEKSGEGLALLLDELGERLGRLVKLAAATQDDHTLYIISVLKNLIVRLSEIKILVREFSGEMQPEWIYWADLYDKEIKLQKVPRSTRSYLRQAAEQGKASILISRIFKTEDSFAYYEKRLGIEDFETFTIKPEFSSAHNSAMVVVRDIPFPNSEEYNNEINSIIVDTATVMKSGVVAVFTSYSQIKNTYKKIAVEMRDRGMEVLAQGVSGGIKKIAEKFKKNPRHVLLITNNFWEVVDLPSEIIKCLLIVKIPFSVPFEPVFYERSREYKNDFGEFSLPQAILRFRQNFGKIIKYKNDQGLIIILDRRIENPHYGAKFLNSVPTANIFYLKKSEMADIIEKFS